MLAELLAGVIFFVIVISSLGYLEGVFTISALLATVKGKQWGK
jgi:hypothetical protein